MFEVKYVGLFTGAYERGSSRYIVPGPDRYVGARD